MHRVIHTPSLVLASQSRSRAQMMAQAGIEFTSVPSFIDESSLKLKARHEGWSIEETALELAREKALAVSKHQPGQLIIGADQMMSCEGQWFDKAQSLEEAKQQLRFLCGKPHRLISACVLFIDGREIWSIVVCPELLCRDFSEAFIDFYFSQLGDEALHSVGCYQIEGMGAQLFERIEGDIFTIMGLPLFPLMAELRRQGVLLS